MSCDVTLADIAAALGIKERAVAEKAKTGGWHFVLGPSSGGRPPRLYPVTFLPRDVRDALDRAAQEKLRAELAAKGIEVTPRRAPLPAPQPAAPPATNPEAIARRDAKLQIFEAFRALQRAGGYSGQRAREVFVTFYELAAAAARAGEVASVPEPLANLSRDVFEAVPGISSRTLRRIVDTIETEGGFARLAGAYGGRGGTAPLECGLIGDMIPIEVAIIAIIVQAPQIAAPALAEQLAGQFGPEIILPSGELVPIPPVRTIQRHLARIRVERQSTILGMVDPDRWRSEKQYAFGTAYAGVGLNDLWMIDASPTDILLTDGRYSIYALIDVWSRRLMVLVTRTPRAEAVVALLRRAILEWGVPREVRTDNGSDFVAYRTRGVLHSLGIEHTLSPAFTPTDKAFVERVIGTIQHRFMALQPGFIGHCVADRKKIEARKSFAARLGEKDEDVFCVELDQDALQRRLNAWVENDYMQRPHEGIDRETPAHRVAMWSGTPRVVSDERALDLLLAELATNNGIRRVTKKGIGVERATFWGPGLEPGRSVRVRLDPTDMGRIYVYSVEGDEFICVAKNPERLGISRAEVAGQARADQAKRVAEEKREINKVRRKLKPLGEIAEKMAREKVPPVIRLPVRGAEHETPGLSAAAQAAASERLAPPSPEAKPVVTPATIIPMPARKETPGEIRNREKRERYQRYKDITAALAAGRPVSDRDRAWHGVYGREAECLALTDAEAMIAAGLIAG